MQRLTRAEKAILDIIREAQGRVVSRDVIVGELYERMGKTEPQNAEKQLDVHIFRIRKKGYNIETVWGRGFRMDKDPLTEFFRQYENAIHWLKAHHPKVHSALQPRLPRPLDGEFHIPSQREGP